MQALQGLRLFSWAFFPLLLAILFNTWVALSYSVVGGDFDQDYFGAMRVLQGEPLYLDLRGTPNPRLIDNFHPPFNALIFAPFTLFSLERAFLFWHGISLFSVVAGTLLLLDRFSPLRRQKYLWLACVLAWFPTLSISANGQLSGVIFFMAILASHWIAEGKMKSAAAVIGVSGAMKIFPLFLLLYFLLVKQYRPLVVAGTVFVGCHLCALLLVEHEEIAHYFLSVSRQNVERYGTYPPNLSLSALYYTITQGSFLGEKRYIEPLLDLSFLGVFGEILLLAVLYGVVVAVAVKRSHQAISAENPLLAIGYLSVGMVLCSPISWEHILLVTLPLILSDLSRRLAGHRDWRWVYALSAIVSVSLPSIFYFKLLFADPAFEVSWFFFALGKLPVLGLFLFLWLPPLGVKGEREQVSSSEPS